MSREKAAGPTSTVEISISCRNLENKDTLSKSDPMAVLFHRPPGSTHWVELLRTEIVEDDLNPDFAEKATMEYFFEERQLIRIEVYEVDKQSEELADHDMIGFAECSLAMVVSVGSSGFKTNLIIFATEGGETASPEKTSGRKEKKVVGELILTAEELSALKDEATLKFGGNAMGSPTCCLIPPKIFYTISRVGTGGKCSIVYRSEFATGTNPIWPQMSIPLRRICSGDRDQPMKIEVFQKAAESVLIGYCTTTINKMMSLGTGGIALEESDSTASLLVLLCKIEKIYTFLDYLGKGTQIQCCISIDFTASNGPPKDKTSLHYTSPLSVNEPNPYEQAIQAVGTILEDYDSDKLFPVYGFGARIPPHRQVSHNFYVTLTENAYCYGVEGILETYRTCMSRIELYAPTNFAPVINCVSEQASQNDSGKQYTILLIITDGVITDMPFTKEAIVKASALPISVIIIGVGDEDYKAMEELDGDAVRITYKGKRAVRDIVQFVPYRDAHSWLAGFATAKSMEELEAEEGGEDPNIDEAEKRRRKEKREAIQKMAQERLAQEVLGEIPDQLTKFMKMNKIEPGNFIEKEEAPPQAAT